VAYVTDQGGNHRKMLRGLDFGGFLLNLGICLGYFNMNRFISGGLNPEPPTLNLRPFRQKPRGRKRDLYKNV